MHGRERERVHAVHCSSWFVHSCLEGVLWGHEKIYAMSPKTKCTNTLGRLFFTHIQTQQPTKTDKHTTYSLCPSRSPATFPSDFPAAQEIAKREKTGIFLLAHNNIGVARTLRPCARTHTCTIHTFQIAFFNPSVMPGSKSDMTAASLREYFRMMSLGEIGDAGEFCSGEDRRQERRH
jgi:hypothetical protein